MFGVVRGTLYATVGATIGASIAFLILRRGIDGIMNTRHGKRLERLNKRLQRYGVSYLLFLHFSALAPYAIINLLAAVSRVPLRTVVAVTAVGFLPYGLIYSFAGQQFTTIQSMRDIFSRNVIIAFTLLMLLTLIPLIIKRVAKGDRG